MIRKWRRRSAGYQLLEIPLFVFSDFVQGLGFVHRVQELEGPSVSLEFVDCVLCFRAA